MASRHRSAASRTQIEHISPPTMFANRLVTHGGVAGELRRLARDQLSQTMYYLSRGKENSLKDPCPSFPASHRHATLFLRTLTDHRESPPPSPFPDSEDVHSLPNHTPNTLFVCGGCQAHTLHTFHTPITERVICFKLFSLDPAFPRPL